MSGIGIVGFGISGLHLALYLQQQGVDATLYSPRPMSAFASGPITNFVTRWGPTLDRERTLGVVDTGAVPGERMRIRIAVDPTIDLDGTLAEPSDTTDFRLYLPRLLEIFEARGGRVEVTPCGPGELASLGARHDLTVVAAGRDGFGGVFPLDPARSPHRVPPRTWTVALYEGLDLPERDIDLIVVPGVGEFIHVRHRSFPGVVPSIAVAAVPGGPMEGLVEHRYADDPGAFRTAFLAALRAFAPDLRAKVDETRFAPTRPLDILQGAILPAVHRAWSPLADGRYALCIGDAWVVNDPLIAQGANLGSRTAFLVGAAIAAGGPYDEAFCRRTEAAMWSQAAAPCMLTDTFLAPPPPHVVEFLAQAADDPASTDRVLGGLGYPDDLLSLLAPPQGLTQDQVPQNV